MVDAKRDESADELLLQLPNRPDAPSVARRAVARHAKRYLSAAAQSDLALAVSEVVTNAIRYGGEATTIELRARRTGEALRVEVTDAGAGLVPQPRATESSPDGGFGLFLVEQLARRWGLVRHLGTTRVWFEFELTRR